MMLKNSTFPYRVLLLSLTLVAITAHSQIAQWLIEPKYDNIRFAEGVDVLITDSLGNQALWSVEGRLLSRQTTQEQIHSFHNGYAVVTDKTDKEHITGFYAANGTFTPLDYQVANSFLQFSDGFLLVKNTSDNYYLFVSTNGTPVSNRKFVSARPFNRGYASCETYENMQKEKDLYPLLLSSSTMSEVQLRYGNEDFKRNDINFISSINDEGKGIIVHKKRVFLFDAATQSLSPLYATSNGPHDKKDKQVKVIDEHQVVDFAANNAVIRAMSDKTRQITITLDATYAPQSIQYADELITYQPKAVSPRTISSPLNGQRDEFPNNIYSLYWDTTLVLPSQLDAVGNCFNDKAMIKINGKWGLVKVYPNETFNITINEGKEIPFRHKTQQVPIRLYAPAAVPIEQTKLVMIETVKDSVPSAGCRIDYNSARITSSRDSKNPGHIDYQCEVDFPSYLPDEISEDKELNAIDYSAQVIYKGLKSPILPIKAYGWQYKYITLKTEDESIDQYGNFSCKLNLEKDIKSANEIEYPLKINIQSDSLTNSYTKQSEVLYTILVYGLHEGTNTFEVTVSEGDDPTIDTSSEIEVYYEKPSRPSKDKQPIKPKVVVKAKHSHRSKATPSTNQPQRESIWYLPDL